VLNKHIPTINELQNQLTDLKAEILELSGTISQQVAGVTDKAQPAFDEVGHRVRDAVEAGLTKGKAMVDTLKENPGTVSSVALTAGLLGVLAGYVFGLAIHSSSPRSRR
jgi:hypothetical protein